MLRRPLPRPYNSNTIADTGRILLTSSGTFSACTNTNTQNNNNNNNNILIEQKRHHVKSYANYPSNNKHTHQSPRTSFLSTGSTTRSSSNQYEAAKILKQRNYRIADHDPQELAERRNRAVNERMQGRISTGNNNNIDNNDNMIPTQQEEFDYFNDAQPADERRKVTKRQGARSMPRDYDIDIVDEENTVNDDENETMSSSSSPQEQYREDELHQEDLKNLRYKRKLPPNYYSETVRTPELDGLPGEWMRRSRGHQPGEEIFRSLTTGETLGTEFSEVENFGGPAKVGEHHDRQQVTHTQGQSNNDADDDDSDLPPVPRSKMAPPVYETALELPKLKSYHIDNDGNDDLPPLSKFSSTAFEKRRQQQKRFPQSRKELGEQEPELEEEHEMTYEERQQRELENVMKNARENENDHYHQQEIPTRNNRNHPSQASRGRDDEDPHLDLLRQFTKTAQSPSQESIALLARELAVDMMKMMKVTTKNNNINKNNDNDNYNEENKNEVAAREQEQEQQQEEQRRVAPASMLLLKLRRTARIASQHGAWEGALGLMTALRVAPFVEVDDVEQEQQQQDDAPSTALIDSPNFIDTSSASSSTSSSSPPLLRQDYVSANYAVALAVSQSAMNTNKNSRHNKHHHHRQKGNEREYENENDEEISSSISPTDISPAITIAKTAMMTDLHHQQLNESNNSTSTLQQRLAETSILCTNYIVSSACRISSLVPRAKDPQQWMTAMSLLKYLNIHHDQNNNKQQQEYKRTVPFAVQNAIPFAFAAVARSLRNCGQFSQAVSLLEDNYHQAIAASSSSSSSSSFPLEWTRNPTPHCTLARLSVLSPSLSSSSSSTSSEEDLLDYILKNLRFITDLSSSQQKTFDLNNTCYETALTCLKTLFWNLKTSSSSSTSTNYLQMNVDELFDNQDNNNDSNQNKYSSSSLTSSSVLKERLLTMNNNNEKIDTSKNSLESVLINYCLKEILPKCPVDSAETISSLASLLSVSDFAVNELSLCEDLISFVNRNNKNNVNNNNNDDEDEDDLRATTTTSEKEEGETSSKTATSSSEKNSTTDQNQKFSDTFRGQLQQQQKHHHPYVQILSKTNLLAHPLVLAGLMKSCVRNSKYQLATELFETVVPVLNSALVIDTNNISSGDHHDEESLLFKFPESLFDRRPSFDNIDILVGAIFAKHQAVRRAKKNNNNTTVTNANNDLWSASAAETETEEEENLVEQAQQILSIRIGLIKTVHQLLSKYRNLSRKLEKQQQNQHQHQQHHRNRNSSNATRELQQSLISLSRTLSLYAPTLHERGVNECVVAYLASIDGIFSSSSTNNNNNNIVINKSEIISHVLTAIIPESNWRNAFLPQLFQLLYHHGMHGKVSAIYHRVQQGATPFLDDDFLIDTEGDDENGGDQEFDSTSRGRSSKTSTPLDPASVDFETLQLAQRQERKEKWAVRERTKKELRREQVKNRGRPDLMRDRSGSVGDHNSKRLTQRYSLPLVLDAKSLCFCVHSLCENEHYRLATKIAEDELLGGQEVVRKIVAGTAAALTTGTPDFDDDNDHHETEQEEEDSSKLEKAKLKPLTIEQEREMSLSGIFEGSKSSSRSTSDFDSLLNEQIETAVAKVKSGLMISAMTSKKHNIKY